MSEKTLSTSGSVSPKRIFLRWPPAKYLIGIIVAVAVLIGAFNWARYAERDTRTLAEALNDATLGLEEKSRSHLRQLQREQNHDRVLRAIDRGDFEEVASLRTEMERLESEWKDEDRQRELIDVLRQKK